MFITMLAFISLAGEPIGVYEGPLKFGSREACESYIQLEGQNIANDMSISMGIQGIQVELMCVTKKLANELDGIAI